MNRVFSIPAGLSRRNQCNQNQQFRTIDLAMFSVREIKDQTKQKSM
ncbi:hypothetical protein [Chitinophaga silvatica]|nr:hypothetical protein [Chitinophaga silvatica]